MFETLYINKNSILNNLDFWIKSFCVLIIPSTIAFLASPMVLVLVLLYLTLLISLGRLPLRVIWRQIRYISVLFFVIAVSLSVFYATGELAYRIFIGVMIFLKFVVAILFGMVFSLITDPIEIPTSMMRVKIPHRYGVFLMVAYRMIPLILEKIASIKEIQEIRGARISYSFFGLSQNIKFFLSLAIPIVYTTLETSVGLSDTLIARGYNPYSKFITIPPSHLKIWDFIILLPSIFLLLSLFLLK